MQVRDFKKTMSGFVHGFRHNISALSNILEVKYQKKCWPSQSIVLNLSKIVQLVIQRLSISAALFLQPGFLCDLLVIGMLDQKAIYYQDIPLDYIRDSNLGKHNNYYTITLEYGLSKEDSLSIEREPDVNKAFNDTYLHPVIRHFDGLSLLGEHHLPEHLESDLRPNHHPGERPMLQSLEYIGQSQQQNEFQEIYTHILLDFLKSEMSKNCLEKPTMINQ